MMTRQEFEYIRRAVGALDDPETPLGDQYKIMRTVSQLFDMAAKRVEMRLYEASDLVDSLE